MATRWRWRCLIKPFRFFWLLGLLLAACTGEAVTSPQTAPAGQTTRAAVQPPAGCTLEPLLVPTLLPDPPGYALPDKSIGLHVTGRAQEIDPQSYRLKVTGLVEQPLELTLDELRCMPRVSGDPLLVCEGYFTDQADWTGVSMKQVLDLAGLQPEATSITLVSADGYLVTLSMLEALNEGNILAYEVNGQTLPVLHGFPLRAVLPMTNGNNWVKWLVEIRVE
ncbi:MAG: molybdopterin-dependent oxidoreductase [Anaerolineaceae bacterium]